MKQKSTITFLTTSILFIILLIVSFSIVNIVGSISLGFKIGSTVVLSLFAFFFIFLLVITSYMIKKKREDIKRGFDYYIEQQISTTGVGVIIFNNEADIIWISKVLQERIGVSLIGKKIMSISPEFSKRYLNGDKVFKFSLEGVILEASVNVEEKTILIKDVTAEETILKNYNSEKNVIGELEIDNFQQFQVSLSEEELFKVQSSFIEMLDKLVEKYNFIYRQYVNGKYIFFTNQETLDVFIKTDFKFLNNIRNQKVSEGINLTASIGVSSNSIDKKELTELAREGLRQAQSRGGDQVTLMLPHQKPVYFGSKVEQAKTISRVKIKQLATRFEQRISDPSIKNVIIYGHQYADLDAVGASLGVSVIANTFNKEWNIGNVTFDSTTEGIIKGLDKSIQDKFIKGSKANSLTTANTIVVMVDTPDVSRIENQDVLKKIRPENFFIFDHHRPTETLNEIIDQNNVYIDTSSSSASEIVSELMTFFSTKIKIKREEAQMLLNGIYLDTKSFTKSVSTRTFAAASWLESNGANTSISSEILRIPENASHLINSILTRIEEIKPGYFLASYEGEIEQDIISMAADEILRTRNRKAAFVVAKVPGKNVLKMSARGIDTNVQKIAEAVGGGGHFGAAAATSTESLPVFIDNIRQAIVSKHGDE